MTESLISHFQMMARYNRRANERLYAACAGLTDGERKRDREAFFGSIHGTLNHILMGDRIWLGRFAGKVTSSQGLDAILYDDFAALHAVRAEEDRRIEHFTAGLDAAFLDRGIAYRNNEGRDLCDPAAAVLAHFFNHQTHHRGQVHDMLSQAGATPPVLDLHRVLNP